jgi:hydrogenase nickel incorporation protein HypA/HybF
MHDRALMNDLIKQLGRLAREGEARRVVAMRVRLGALSHLTPEHFREHFEEAARGGPAEGATIDIVTSTDIADPGAQGVVLESVDLETNVHEPG